MGSCIPKEEEEEERVSTPILRNLFTKDDGNFTQIYKMFPL
jgi:hypothetical protein